LLIIYGSDVFVKPRGFLPFSVAVRGSLLGGGAVIMSIIGFMIGRKEPSNAVSILLFINGGLIIAGLIALISQGALASSNSSSTARTTIGSTIGLGVILLGLGVWKVMIDRKKFIINRR
jgi:phosphate/sulfate permease